jgi:hypothetical protein
MKFVQSFKDRFLARGGGRIERFVLSAYGKLPIYKDYIMWECHAGGAAEMKRWLDESFGLTWEEFGGKGVLPAGPARALLLLPGGKWAVAAALRPSTDEGGLRKFPMTMFAVFGRGEIIGRGVRGAIEALTPIWEALEGSTAAWPKSTTSRRSTLICNAPTRPPPKAIRPSRRRDST